VAATGDPLYQAVSDGRRLAGMEHWLPLFEDRLATLFDHLGEKDQIVIDVGAIAAGDERLADIADYQKQRKETAGQAAGSYRPLETEALYLSSGEFEKALAEWPVHRATAFSEPESASVLDFGFRSARDFTPERAQGANVYAAAALHLKA